MTRENEIISKVLLSIEQYKGDFSVFRNSILSNEYNTKNKNFTRLLLWKTCLITGTLNIQAWKEKLRSCRALYHELRRTSDMIVPWWMLESDSEFFSKVPTDPNICVIREPQIPVSVDRTKADLLGHEFPSQRFCESDQRDVELLKIIVLDVQRLFPGDLLFQGHNNHALKHKRQLITILFIWSKCNPQVGYKQGLHEILGLIYKNILAESLVIPNTNTLSSSDIDILSLYDLRYLEHDLFLLFNKFVVSSGVAHDFYESEIELMESIERFNSLLMKVDQLIHYNLITKLKLESQLWIIRFFRLLLSRELGNDLEVSSSFWDKLAAAEASAVPGQKCVPKLVTFSIIILLIHLKAELALCDFSEALSMLLHYPISTRMHLYPNFVECLFEDAYNLLKLSGDDFRLYEYGLKLNKKYASVVQVSFESPQNMVDLRKRFVANPLKNKPTASDIRQENMTFEKNRLELRLKKRAQSILKK